jgi:hypothetical protein
MKLRKTTKDRSEDSKSPGLESNLVSPDYDRFFLFTQQKQNMKFFKTNEDKLKPKQPHYRPRQALRGPGG